jgi:hypothetical protein
MRRLIALRCGGRQCHDSDTRRLTGLIEFDVEGSIGSRPGGKMPSAQVRGTSARNLDDEKKA